MSVSEGSLARYRVREQLATINFLTDAVGETSEVSGQIVFDAEGGVQTASSVLTVNVRSLRSDDSRRDRYLSNNSLQSKVFPEAVFRVEEARELPWPLPEEGEVSFQLVGEMTVHGVTRPSAWTVTAHLSPDIVTGQARTSFTFGEYGMTVPTVFIVLSVEDNIRLELDFVASLIRG